MEIDYKAIGQRIKIARIKKGITQEAVADIIDITPAHMSNVETGKTKVSLPTLIEIANALSLIHILVEEAKRRGLSHEERHAKVEYLVTHGIASSVDEEQVCIGSAHFIFENEKCVVPAEERDVYKRQR